MRTKREISEYIQKHMKIKGVTKTKLGELLGAHGTTQQRIQKASQFLQGKNEKIDLKKLSIVAKHLDLTADQILIRNRDLKKHISELKNIHIHQKHFVPLIKSNHIPGLTTTEEDISEWIVWPYISVTGKHVAIKVQNKEIDAFSVGDILVVDTRQHLYNLDTKIVLGREGSDWFIRRFKRTKNGHITLMSDIPEKYPDKIFTPEDDFVLIGPIVGTLKPYQYE